MRPQSDKQAAKTREGCFPLYLAVIHTEWYTSNYAKRMINENVAFANDLFTQYNDFYIAELNFFVSGWPLLLLLLSQRRRLCVDCERKLGAQRPG